MNAGHILVLFAVGLYRTPFISTTELPEDLAEIFDDAEIKCLQIHQIPADEHRSLMKTLTGMSSNIKCYLSCFFEEVGLMKGTDLNGTLYEALLEEEMKMTTGVEDGMASLRTCIESVNDTEKCQKAYEYYKCLGHRFSRHVRSIVH